jgi:hypothetical protein
MSLETLLLSVVAASAALADLVVLIKLFGSQSDLPHKLAWSFVLVEFPIMGLLFWSIARTRSAGTAPAIVRSK